MSRTRIASAQLAQDALRERLEALPVVVLAGGTSGEREVSLTSSRAIHAALAGAPEDAQAARGPAEVIDVELSSDGRWIVAGQAMSAAAAIEALPAESFFFLGLHGGAGENGTLQGLLEACGKAYSGSGVESSALCMNKELTRRCLQAAGLRVAGGRLVTAAAWRDRRDERDACLEELRSAASAGWYVKPNRGGSSLATFPVRRGESLVQPIETVLASGDDALVEEWIEGVEATCGVLGGVLEGDGGGLRALPIVEIVPKEGRFFDYAEKYDADGADEFCPPRSLSAATCERLQREARRAFEICSCAGYARVDFIVPPSGAPVALELNTLPGFTPRSLLPQAAQVAGLDFRALCLELVALGLMSFDARATR